MSTPAIIFIILMSIELLYRARIHGRPKEGQTENFWVGLFSLALLTALLLWGGFFK